MPWYANENMRRKTRRYLRLPESVDELVPASLAALAALAGPIQIVLIDLDQPLPIIRVDDRYQTAWIVMSRDGIPLTLESIDLTIGESAIQNQLEELATRPELSALYNLEHSRLPEIDLPRISVVIPTIVSRVEELGHCIEAVGEIDYPNFEVLLVDNRRTLPAVDPLLALIEDRPWLRVIRESRPGVSAARNAGLAEADGEVIAFTDDDVRVDRMWLRAIGTRMALNPRMDAVSGLILPTELETPAQIWFERYYGGFSGQRTFAPVELEIAPKGHRVTEGNRVIVRDSSGEEIRRISILAIGGYGAGANMAFRKSALERIGGFDFALGVGTPARGGEDLVPIIAILWSGGLVGYEPASFVRHRHRRDYSALMTQLEGNGVGFTAMLTSLVRNYPRYSLGILSQLPEVLKWKVAQGVERVRGKKTNETANPTSAPHYPLTMLTRELSGYFSGPFAYARSRSRWKRIISTQASPDK